MSTPFTPQELQELAASRTIDEYSALVMLARSKRNGDLPSDWEEKIAGPNGLAQQLTKRFNMVYSDG